MDSKLVKRVFDRSEMLGFRTGQIRTEGVDRYISNAGLYNSKGERLGSGDLSVLDIRRMAEELERLDSDELVIILFEADSCTWLANPPYNNRDQDAPGIDYVAAKCCVVVVRDHLYHLIDKMSKASQIDAGLRAEALNRKEVMAWLCAG